MAELSKEEFTALVQLALKAPIQASDAVVVGTLLQKAVAIANATPDVKKADAAAVDVAKPAKKK